MSTDTQAVTPDAKKHDGPKAFTADEIRDAQQTWTYSNGFSGESCGSCKATANVLAGGPGWFCGCGHYNVQSWSHHQIPHDSPDYGPTQAVIAEGHSS